jgi:SulP family sulfate permease
MCSAVNEIDLSALETLEAINIRLNELGIDLSLSEVKGPVMDGLARAHLLAQPYLSQFAVFQALVSSQDSASIAIAQSRPN